MTPAKVHMAKAAMGKPATVVNDLCEELGISRQTLYRYVSPTGALRPTGGSFSRSVNRQSLLVTPCGMLCLSPRSPKADCLIRVTLAVRFHRTQFDKFIKAGKSRCNLSAAFYQRKERWRKSLAGTPYSKPLKAAWLTNGWLEIWGMIA